MFGSPILEVAIGIIFVFILVSIICTVIREVIEGLLKTRAAFLEHGIRELLHDKNAEGLVRSLYNHPLIYSLFSETYNPKPAKRPGALANGSNLPSYIPTKNFAQALMDLAARGLETDMVSSGPEAPLVSLAAIRQNIANLKNPDVQRVVLMAVDSAQGDLNKAQAALEAWYDSGMDRVSGWYKRKSQWIIFWIGLFVAVSMNIDTVAIANYLSHDDVARAALVANAEALQKNPDSIANYQQATTALNSVSLPIGWSDDRPGQKLEATASWNNLIGPLFGWLITALAAMLGAPFWFDTLNKVMVIRSTVKPHEKSKEEASEDRQAPDKAAPPAATTAADAATAALAANAAAAAAAVADNTNKALAAPANDGAHDHSSRLDGCDVEAEDFTADEALPAATGGVI